MKWRETIRGWWGGNGELDLAERGLDSPGAEERLGTGLDAVNISPSGPGIEPQFNGPVSYPPQPIPISQSMAKPAADRARRTIDAEVDQSALGLSGTANLVGFVRDIGEYDPKMQGLQAIHTLEKMRRTDPTVAALEAAIRLPIRAAEWRIEPGIEESEPGFALAKEIAEFVEDNLFSGLETPTASGEMQTQTFESVIENALLCAPLGCAGHEDLWIVDGSRIRLRRLAPRLPLTFYQFVTELDGETLYQLIQFGYRGSQVQIVPVPASKVCLFILNREGANFYGRSVLRSAYLPWYFKNQLMRIDAIGAERNRLAVPTITQGPNASPDDVQKSWQWVTNLSTNERTGLSLPNGWKFELIGPSGRAMPLTETMRFYDEQILMAGLADFLSLGKTASGSRALGDVKLDFFLLSEQALARMIAQTIEVTTLRRLVDHNYQVSGVRGQVSGKNLTPNTRHLTPALPYPRLVCSAITMINIADVVSAVKDLANSAVGWLETSQERDNWLAERLGLPHINASPRPKYAPIVRRIQEMEEGGPGVPDEGAPRRSGVRGPSSVAERESGIGNREPIPGNRFPVPEARDNAQRTTDRRETAND